MKRIFLSLVIMLSCLVVQAEHSYTLFNKLNGAQDYHYTANSHIYLIAGFQSEPKEGHVVILDIDSYNIIPPQNDITGGFAPNNGNGVVGSLGGVIDVSLLGGAVYTIPIDLPLGLGGMKPQLSITYNSQSHNGLLGWAWDLEGISSITRIGGTRYHDGFISNVNYIHDRFCLDGQRLLKVSPDNYGDHGASYRTEQDQLSKIVSYHETGIEGPSYFKVWTADGKILYYGSSSDSKALVNSQNYVNIWLLKKVEDRNGNSIEYHYANDSDTYRLTRITYSANNNYNIQPAFTVEFQYNDRSDIEVSYIGNRVYHQNKILKEIKIKSGNEAMYSYQFKYKAPNPKSGYPYHLLTDVQFFAGDEHYNPTKIQWGSNNYNIGSGADVKLNVTTNGIANAFVNGVKFSGDFNGDGYSDVVVSRPNSEGAYTAANVFINKGVDGNAIFNHSYTILLSTKISWIQVTDFNGDGLDDILLTYRTRNAFPLSDQISAYIHLSHVGESGQLTFNSYQTPICKVSNDLVEAYLVGDFLGEGKSSILIQTTENDKINTSTLLTYSAVEDRFVLKTFGESLSAYRFYTADYNGDGITEILYRNGSGATRIVQVTPTNSGSYQYVETYNGAPFDWDDCFPGDYNGDGLIDPLFYKSGDMNPWTIWLSSTTGISGTVYSLPPTFPYSDPGNYLFSLDQPHNTSQFIKVGDFDGNGCSDLGLIKDNTFYVFYGPLRTTGEDAPFAGSQRIGTQLFNLYDNMTMCLGNFLGQEGTAYLGNNTISHLPQMTRRHEVQKITDGFGRLTELYYDYLMPNPNNPSSDDFYRLGSLPSSTSARCVAIPLRALRKVTRYNIKNKPIETRCFYEGGLLNTNGKGFLGFSMTRQDDYCNNQLQQKIIRLYELNYASHAFHLMPSSESVYDGNGQLMAQSSYTNTIYENNANTKIIIPQTDITKDEYDVDHPGSLIKREIQETTVSTHCSQSYKYHNTISIVKKTKGITENPSVHSANLCEFKHTTDITYKSDNLNLWLFNRPATATETIHHNGNYNDICHKKIFSYFNESPYYLKTVLNLPNDGSHPEDRLATMIAYQYDPTGNIISKTITTPNDRQDPRREFFEYGTTYGKLLLTKHTDALGQITRYSYHPVYHHCTSVIDCNGLETRYEQDPLGITRKAIFPDGTVSYQALRWGSYYYYLWEKSTGQATQYTLFDKTGDIIQKRSYDLDGELLLTDYTYDAFGRVVGKNLPYRIGETPQTIRCEYDSHNRAHRIVHADGTYETLQYNGNIRSTSFVASNSSSQTETKTYNSLGWLTKSTDAEGNSVIYDYYADGKPKSFQIEGHNETRIEMAYDALGNRTLLSDPNYGVTSTEYNAFNELTKSTSPKLDETEYFYDVLGRLTKRIETDRAANTAETTEWHYGHEAGHQGLLMRVTSPNQTIDYEYDELLRLSLTTENTMGADYRTRYAYDEASRVARIIYPSDYGIDYCYSSEGYLRCIMDSQSQELWRISEANTWLQPTKIVTGNGFESFYDYDEHTNRLNSILTIHDDETIQDYAFQYDSYSNMTLRSDLKTSQSEAFSYDALNRLTGVMDSNGASRFSYDELGRMTEKTNANGTVFTQANYSGFRPHAIKSAQTSPGVFPQSRMDLSFNSFDKISSISQGNNNVTFEYGFDHQRIKTLEHIDGTAREKTYVGNCEFIDSQDGDPMVRTFISCPTGVFAVAETIDGKTQLHYVHKDHLGSWTTISDSDGNLEQEVQFDAWGHCEKANDLMFDRGYTGHEHIKGMGLINMNGRLYDPITSSMLSPDNNIQMSDFTQNLNRYSYCYNNPLTYTDPSGNDALFYLLFCTDFGYELQKYTSPVAFHVDLHLSSQQIGIGADCSVGIPKYTPVSVRFHAGGTYYWQYYDNSYRGMEYRAGMEWCFLGYIGISGTSFYQGNRKQTTNAIILGNPYWSIIYENDYMFHIGDYLLFDFAADGGDRYRSAAARIRIGLFQIGVNLYTGDPGVDSKDRRTFFDPDTESTYYNEEMGGRETYTIGANGENPDEFRAGVFYVGYGPFKVGVNSEQVRNTFQNRFAHDYLCKGDSPYFKVLDRPSEFYFYFGTGTGNSLW